MALFDGTSFPFSDPRGQELKALLNDAYSDAPSIGMLLDQVGIPRQEVNLQQPPNSIWHEVLAAAARSGQMGALIEAVLEDASRRAFHEPLRSLLAETGHPDPSMTQVVVGNVPQEPPGYLARGTVDDLAAVLDQPRDLRVCALTGAAGLGKTQIAAAYARRRIVDGWTLVGWVNAETPDRLLAELATIAKELLVADPLGDSAKSAQNLTKLLITRSKPGLIVFDNAREPDLVGTYLPPTSRMHIVITTTNQSFADLVPTVPVETFTLRESIGLLQERSGRSDSAGARRIATELGNHPLAVARAAAEIRRLRLDYGTYRRRLAVTPIEKILPRLPGEHYELATAQALLLGADRKGDIGRLLRLLAVLSPDGVSRDILSQLPQVIRLDEDVDELLARCADESLITWSVKGDEVTLHRLQGRVLREKDQLEGRYEETTQDAAALLDRQRVPEDLAWARRAFANMLIDQIDALWSVLPPAPQPGSGVAPTVLDQRSWAVGQLISVADPQRAIDLGRAVLTERERILGPEHPTTLSSRNDLAVAHESAGFVDEAIRLFELNMKLREGLQGVDHPDTLTSRNNLAGAYESAKRYDESIALYERTLADRERVLGMDHQSTLTSRNNLAYSYESAGRLDRAIELYERTLNDRLRVLGNDHRSTLTSRTNLAYAYLSGGRVADAIALLETNVADCDRVLGLDHPDTLSTRRHLARAYLAAGRYGTAIELFESSLKDRRRALGADHPSVLTSRNDLAQAYIQAGRYSDGIRLLEQILADRERVDGDTDPGVQDVRDQLARARDALNHGSEPESTDHPRTD